MPEELNGGRGRQCTTALHEQPPTHLHNYVNGWVVQHCQRIARHEHALGHGKVAHLGYVAAQELQEERSERDRRNGPGDRNIGAPPHAAARRGSRTRSRTVLTRKSTRCARYRSRLRSSSSTTPPPTTPAPHTATFHVRSDRAPGVVRANADDQAAGSPRFILKLVHQEGVIGLS